MLDNYTLVTKKYKSMYERGLLDDCFTTEEIACAIFPQLKSFDIEPCEVLHIVKNIFE